MNEQSALLILNAIPGLGAVKIKELIRVFGSAVKVLEQNQNGLMASGVVTGNMTVNIVHFSKDKFLEDEYNLVQQAGAHVITWADELYPSMLREIPGAPFVLYVLGKVDLLNSVSVGMVGSRAASYYGLSVAEKFAKAFAVNGLTVISGLARGIDTAAHQGALKADGQTIAVLGCGLNFIYPKENAKLKEQIAEQGAVVSEMPMNTAPIPANFPRRNRIISGLSLATVVVEAAIKSGALITADFALEQGRDVFAVPANIDTIAGQGSNRLIKDGAKVALAPEDVMRELKTQVEWAFEEGSVGEVPKIKLAEEEMDIYTLIAETPAHIDDLALRAKQAIGSTASVLLNLELKGIVRQLPGKYYVKV